jgi:uncharacterized membrane protein YoaK (UPF0700 family)
MRYLVQFLIPALVFVVVVYLVTRRRRAGTSAAEGKDTAAFVVILALGAVVALGVALLLSSLLE